MNLSPYEIALIAGGFSLTGVLLGARIGYRNALNLYGIAEFNKAATTFRSAFLPEIIYLKYNAKVVEAASSSDLQEFLFSAYVHRHLAAFEVFKSNLCSSDMVGIDKAWKKYCCNPNNPEALYFEQYSCKGANRDHESNLKKISLERIEEILKYAEQKR